LEVDLLVVDNMLVVEGHIFRVQQVLNGLVEGVGGLRDASSHDYRNRGCREKKRLFQETSTSTNSPPTHVGGTIMRGRDKPISILCSVKISRRCYSDYL
jgi:hypothetical protein